MASAGPKGLAGNAVPHICKDSLTELERARQVLQAEIDAHKAQIIEKTRRLNNLVDINRLPPEILSEIFIHWTNAAKRMFTNRPYHRPKQWIEISHVCHLWREIALSTPRLWSQITADKLDWTREMLSRSKKAPLKIQYPSTSGHRKDHQELLTLVLGELHRIESLTVCENVAEFCKPPDVASIAPQLSSLSFVGHHRNAPTGSLFTVLENIAMPKLTCLDLSQTLFPWSTPLLQHSLTRLIFNRSPAALGLRQPQSTDFAYVLKTLEGMPLLQYLELSNVLPILREATLPQPDHHITLPALHYLSVNGPSNSCAFLLQHLTIPHSASLKISCGANSDNSVLNIASAFASKLRESGSSSTIAPLHTLHYSTTSIRIWRDSVDLDTICDDYSPTTTEPQFSLTVLSATSCQPLSSTLLSLPLAQIQSLALHLPNPVNNDASGWLRIFAHMPDVRELAVKEQFADISEALRQRLPLPVEQRSQKSRQKKGGIPLPNLKVLRLVDVTFREYLEQLDEETVLHKCKEMLQTRKKSRRAVERLVITRALNFRVDDEDILSPLVKDFEWDGDVRWIDVEDEDDYDEDDFDEDGFHNIWGGHGMMYPPPW